MKIKPVILLLLFFSNCQTKKNEPVSTNSKLLRHVALFSFKETSTKQNIKIIEAAFINLTTKIKEIKDFEWGLNNSPEALHKEFSHSFLVTFTSEKDRNAYLINKDHKAFVKILTPYLNDVLVVDYWT